MNKKLILIVGLQKSGTTLLSRLLRHSGRVENPFKKEGHDFWGDLPPSDPSGSPTGTIYQRNKGEDGHVIGTEGATPQVRKILFERLRPLMMGKSVVLNKNPYNTVRLPWLRQLFPEAYIVAIVRRPVSNVFSLLKKHTPHQGRGNGPRDGWWGVKPSGWRKLRHPDRVVQSARQWRAVNRKLWEDRDCLDRLVYYHALCMEPAKAVQDILKDVTGRIMNSPVKYPKLIDFDSEHLRGSPLRSKNKYFKQYNSFETPVEEKLEIEPFTPRQICEINDICGVVSSCFEGLL